MTGIKKLAKVTVLDFEGKFTLCSKWVKWVKLRLRLFYLGFTPCKAEEPLQDI